MKNFFKAFICVVMGVVLMLTAVACNNNQGGNNPLPNNYTRPSNPNIDNTFTATSNTLVAYFSQTNRTKNVAETISELSGADIFKIDTAQPYTSRDLDYSISNNRPEVEHNTNARPELATYLSDEVIAQYDTIILGFPIWWHTAPMAVLSFLNYYDLSGKTIYTFATSGGSPISESTADIRSNTQATVTEGRLFNGSNETTIRNWLDGLGLISSPEQPDGDMPQDNRPGAENTNVLVVYFSMPETTDPDNMTTEEANSTVIIDGVVLGNTQYMAYVIQDNSGADIFRIIPKVPYPTDHRTLVDQASAEKAQGARPEIKDTITNLDKYDTVFVGYPNWWGDMPMIMYTFFDTYDFSGKTIIPFNTHGGSGFSSTISTIRRLEPNAIVKEGLSISRNNIQDAEQQIVTWVNGLGFYKPSEDPSEPTESSILVVYFSASGSTKRVAEFIADATGGDLFELVPVNPYTSADLNYGNQSSRVVLEHNDESLQDIELVKSTVDNWDAYDTIFIGYPIWWGIAAWPVNNFIKNNDFTGKTVIPFCTAASSPIGQSGMLLAQMASTGNWQTGTRFYSNASQSDVVSWVNGLSLAA